MHQEEFETEEIDLMDYIKLILKRKKLILVLFLVGLAVGGILTFLLPAQYKIESIIEIGNLGISTGTTFVPQPPTLIETPAQLIEEIKNDVYGNYPGMKVSNPLNTNLIKIELTFKNPKDLEITRKNFEDLTQAILIDHNDKINSYKNNLEKIIGKLKNDIGSLILKNQQIVEIQLRVYSLQNQIDTFQPTKIITNPTVSEKKPNLALNLISGGILGLFLGLIFVFGKEWWEKRGVDNLC